MATSITFNSGNRFKIEQFTQIFARHGIAVSLLHNDLAEIDATPEQVVAHKASQLPDGTWVEDSSLIVEGAEVGVNVRWLIEHLPQYAGAKATVTSLMAQRRGDRVTLFRADLNGRIVIPKVQEAGNFRFLFAPEGSDLSMGELNRIQVWEEVVEAAINHRIYQELPLILEWDGAWQK